MRPDRSDAAPATWRRSQPLSRSTVSASYRLAYNVLRDPEEAWDVAQDAFISRVQALASFAATLGPSTPGSFAS